MSLMTYEDARPWARSIKTRVVEPRDAAVAHRSERRHPEVQGRSVVERRRDRDDRQRGSTPGPRSATWPTCRRCVSSPTAPQWQIGKPDLVVRFPAYTVPASRSRSVSDSDRAARHHRRSVHQGDPDPAGRTAASRRVLHHAHHHDGRRPAPTTAPTSGRRRRRRSSSSSTHRARHPRCIRTTRGVLLKAGHTLEPRHTPPLGRRGGQGGSRARLHALSEGHTCRSTSATRPTTAIRVPMRTSRSTSRPAGWSRTDGYTLHTKPAQDHRVPAAHAHPRQVSVHGADLPVESQQDHEARDDQLRALGLQLAPRLQLRGRVAPLVPAGTIVHIISWHDNSRPTTRTTPTRRTGSATVSAPSTRWASRGSGGSI